MNADDIFGELAAARAYVTRGDYTAALEAIDQATKLWAAERDYWALIEADTVRSTTERENQSIRDRSHMQTVRWVGRDY